MIEHLDRIDNLGFSILLNWNKSIEIIYLADNEQSNFNQYPNDIRVLFCAYDNFYEPTFEEVVETACDFFYMWYNRNLETLKDYEIDSTDSNFDKLVDTGLGDITQKVYRDFNIDSLLD
jgi:aminoglycoside/choline kinase family phosphotransferase